MKEDYQKSFKKSPLFFLPNPVSFNVQTYQNQKGPGDLLRLRNKFGKIPLLVTSHIMIIHHVRWCNVMQLLSYFKSSVCKFLQANSWHHKLFYFHSAFCVRKVWKGREKMTKNWISRERKELFRWNGKNFSYFWRAIIWWKNKEMIKNSTRKL